jgi:hypothetical protein
MPTRGESYSALRRIARRRGQRGYFTSAQAEGTGLARMELTRLVRRGLVERAAPRVYRFRIAATTNWKDRLAVELLSTGGVASGLSAPALYDLIDPHRVRACSSRAG